MSSKNIDSATELYEAYKQAIAQHNDYIDELKERVFAIVQKKQLVSVMNDTKWLKLQHAVNALPFPPPNICQCVTYDDEEIEEINVASIFSNAVQWLGDWTNFYEEGLPVLFNIEWIKVRPQSAIFRGCLVEPDVLDETDAFRDILNNLNIPYEEENNVFTIYGYKRLSTK